MHIPTGSIKRNLIGCIFAVGASFLAFLLREGLVAYFGPLPPYLTYYPAVMLVALLGGVWAGIVATLLCGFLGGTADVPRTALFLVMGVSISVVAGLLVQSWKRAAEYQKKLATLEGEKRWRKLAESMPNLVWTCDPRGWCDYISSQWQVYTGIPVERQLGTGWMEQIHPDDRRQLRDAWKRAADSGELYDIEFRVRRHDGQWRWFKNRAVPVRDDSGRIVEWYGSSTDIEDIKRAEDTSRKLYRTLLALSNTNQAALHAEDESVFLQEVCRIIVEECGHAMVWIGFAEWDEARSVRPVAWSGLEAGYIETLKLSWADNERGRGPTGTAIRTGKPGMCQDMEADPAFAPWREEARKRGYKSSLVLPLLERGKAYGALTIYSKQAHAFSPDEVELLTGLARELSSGIISLRTRAAHARSQEELRKGEARLREQNQLLEYAPVLVRNLRDEIILWNKGMERLYGFTSEEALGKVSHEILGTGKPLPTSALLLEKGQWEGELQHRNRNGELMTVLSQQLLYTDADGNPVSIIEINKEITKRKKLEIELRLSEEKFARAFSGNPAAIVMSRLEDGVILEANDTWLDLNGFSRDEIIGRSSRSATWPDAGAAARFLEELREKGSIRNSEQAFHKRSGEPYIVQISAQILDMRGEKVIISTLVDITERKRAEQALAEKTAQLESSIHELESFSYTISHDLRAPLRAIDGFSRMLLRDIGGKLDPESMRKFNVISSNSLKMAQLIEDLLSYSRTGRAAISKSKVDMQSLAQEVWRELRDGSPDRKIEIRIKELPAAYGDRVLLRQVLSNLLGNAVKFTRAKEHAIIEVNGSRNGEASVTYSVNDNGAGFDMQYYDKIFEIFRRLHSEKEFEGTGIGLAIVKKIIEKHGGTIRAEGRPGEGATFHFTLPSR